MSDLQLEATLTANAGPLNSALQSGAQSVQQFSAKAVDAAKAQAGANSASVTSQNALTDAMKRMQAEGERSGRAIRKQVDDLTTLGVSSKQTAAAMRTLPAQMTDIVTQLQGGANPLTILLQQGGQIKDSFGGIGPAMRGLSTLITPVSVGVTALAAAVGLTYAAFSRGEAEASAYRQAIILSGNAAGTTRAQLDEMARSIARTQGTQGAAAEVLAQVTGTGRVAAQNIELVTTAALNLQRYAGVAVADTVAEFVKLGREPVKASAELNEKYNFLTLAVYEQIKALEKAGQLDQAAALAQQTLANAQNERTAQIKANLGSIERASMGVSDAAKRMWDNLLGVGRQTDSEGAIQQMVEKLTRLRGVRNNTTIANLGEFARDLFGKESIEQQIQSAEAVLVKLLEGRQVTQSLAVAERERATEVRTTIKLEDQKAKAAKAAADAYDNARQSLVARAAALQAELDVGQQLNEVQRLELDLRKELADWAKKVGPEQQAILKAEADAVVVRARNVQAQRDQIKLEEEAADAAGRAVDAAFKLQDASAQETERLRQEVEAIGLSAQARAALEQARLSSAVAMYEEQLAQKESVAGHELEAQALRELIAQKREQIELLGMRQRRTEEATFEEGIRRKAEMERQADEARREGIAMSISEGIASGTLSAKGVWDLFRQELVRSFARTVLMPSIRPAVDQADSWIKTAIGAIGSYFSGGMAGDGFYNGSPAGAAAWHGGGVIGVDSPRAFRQVPASAWATAPRFHKGMLAADEVPAVLQKGESVLTPGQLRAVAGAGGPTVVQHITYHVPAGSTPAAYAAAMQDNNERIKSEVAGEMSRPGRALQRAAVAARF
ncbi:MAG: hypothetical protein RL375_140 [Pseudomonadota bacterium]